MWIFINCLFIYNNYIVCNTVHNEPYVKFFTLINYNNILHTTILSKYKYLNYSWNCINECYCKSYALNLISVIGLGRLGTHNS